MTKGILDPARYETVPDVPILDPHSLPATGEEPAVAVSERSLQVIAQNNNARIARTGDLTPVVIGHTKDGQPEDEQPPVVGFADHFRVGPWRGTQALFCDFHIRKDALHALDEYPRRSVELWTKRLEVDPISLLGATTPERDLGLLIRRSRSGTPYGHLTRYARPPRDPADRVVFSEAPQSPSESPMPATLTPSSGPMENCRQMAAAEGKPPGDTPQDLNSADDEGGAGVGDIMSKRVGDMTVGEFLALVKQDSEIAETIQIGKEIKQELDGPGEGEEGLEGGAAPPGGPPPGAGAPPPGGPPMAGPPPGPGGMAPESRWEHEGPPIHYDASPGPMNTHTPTVSGGGLPPIPAHAPPTGPHKMHYSRDYNPAPTAPPVSEEVRRYQRRVEELEKTSKELQTKVAEGERIVRHARRRDQFAAVVTEHHIDMDAAAVQEEVESFGDLSEPAWAGHLELAKRRYAKVAVGGSFLPVAGGGRSPSDPRTIEAIKAHATQAGITDYDAAASSYFQKQQGQQRR